MMNTIAPVQPDNYVSRTLLLRDTNSLKRKRYDAFFETDSYETLWTNDLYLDTHLDGNKNISNMDRLSYSPSYKKRKLSHKNENNFNFSVFNGGENVGKNESLERSENFSFSVRGENGGDGTVLNDVLTMEDHIDEEMNEEIVIDDVLNSEGKRSEILSEMGEKNDLDGSGDKNILSILENLSKAQLLSIFYSFNHDILLKAKNVVTTNETMTNCIKKLIGKWNIIAASSSSNIVVDRNVNSSNTLIFDENCKGSFSYLNFNFRFTLGNIQINPNNSISFICEDLNSNETGQANLFFNDKTLKGTISLGKYCLTFQAEQEKISIIQDQGQDDNIILEDELFINEQDLENNIIIEEEAPINIES